MSRSTFKVLFYLKRNAPKKNRFVPVMCKIAINDRISQFSCKLDADEKLWNVNLDRMSGRSIVAQEANRMLDKTRIVCSKGLCSSEYSKECFELLKTFRVTPENLAESCEYLSPKSGDLEKNPTLN